MMSTSVGVSFLSSSFMSRHSLANLAPSMRAVESLEPAPNAQNSRKVSSRGERFAILSNRLSGRIPNVSVNDLLRKQPHPHPFHKSKLGKGRQNSKCVYVYIQQL